MLTSICQICLVIPAPPQFPDGALQLEISMVKVCLNIFPGSKVEFFQVLGLYAWESLQLSAFIPHL